MACYATGHIVPRRPLPQRKRQWQPWHAGSARPTLLQAVERLLQAACLGAVHPTTVAAHVTAPSGLFEAADAELCWQTVGAAVAAQRQQSAASYEAPSSACFPGPPSSLAAAGAHAWPQKAGSCLLLHMLTDISRRYVQLHGSAVKHSCTLWGAILCPAPCRHSCCCTCRCRAWPHEAPTTVFRGTSADCMSRPPHGPLRQPHRTARHSGRLMQHCTQQSCMPACTNVVHTSRPSPTCWQ